MFKIVPTGFIPTQDQGYLIGNVQMPDASSIERTDAVMTQLADLAMKTKGIKDAFAVSGFSILTRANSSAAGLLFMHLTPFAERAGKTDLTADGVAKRLRQQFSKVEGGQAVVLMPPAVSGIGNAGGVTVQGRERSGTASPPPTPAAAPHPLATAPHRPQVS